MQAMHPRQEAKWLTHCGFIVLAASVATPIAGRVGDMFGKKRTLMVVLAGVAGGTARAAVATTLPLMIAARTVQGLGGAIFPLAFGIVRDELPRERVAGRRWARDALDRFGAELVDLLRALGLLFFRRPELRSQVCLVVVGGALDPSDDASESDKIHELRRLVHQHRMEANVSFVGSLDQPTLALYYAAADLCAVPSLTESFGLGALEAMGCGTPVVGTRVGGLQTLIKDGESGILVPAGDYQALAEAIAQVLGDPRLRMHLAHGARERAEHYSWRMVADRVEELYAKVLTSPKVEV